MLDLDDTIVAIASPSAPSARGIVRLSGSDAVDILARLAIPISVRTAHFVNANIDVGPPIGSLSARALIWPTARSYTGQPSAELHTYGSLPALNALVDAATSAGARVARPGEFTMRAFLAGRLDLTQAEAVLGVIEAEGRGSLDHALRQLAGNLSRPLEHMRAEMLDLLADVEAGLDFVDEDIEFISDENLIRRLSEVSAELDATVKLVGQRTDSDSKIIITLRGEPNAGKSQLVNCLAGQNIAIVADVRGTTRDVVTTDALIEEHNVTLVDTAGIEESESCHITQQSQQHAQRAGESASIRIWCVDSSSPDFDAARARLESVARDDRRTARDLWIATKIDQALSDFQLPQGWIATSSVSGEGIQQLRTVIANAIAARDQQETGSVIGTAARCRGSLTTTSEAISRAIKLTETEQGHEYVSAELRTAVQCLGEVTGAVYTDDILDRVFSRFCIGK